MHPTHYCTQCGALWRQCDDGSWNLRSEKAGPCCDNAPMGEQIKPLAALAQRQQVPEQRAWAYELVERLRFLRIVTDELTLKKINVLAANLDAAAPSAQADRQAVNHATNTDSPIHFPSAQAEPTVPVPTVVAWSGGAAPYRFVRLRLDDTPTEYEYVPTAQAEPQEPLTDEMAEAFFDSFQNDRRILGDFEAFVGTLRDVIERANGIGKQEGK